MRPEGDSKSLRTSALLALYINLFANVLYMKSALYTSDDVISDNDAMYKNIVVFRLIETLIIFASILTIHQKTSSMLPWTIVMFMMDTLLILYDSWRRLSGRDFQLEVEKNVLIWKDYYSREAMYQFTLVMECIFCVVFIFFKLFCAFVLHRYVNELESESLILSDDITQKNTRLNAMEVGLWSPPPKYRMPNEFEAPPPYTVAIQKY